MKRIKQIAEHFLITGLLTCFLITSNMILDVANPLKLDGSYLEFSLAQSISESDAEELYESICHFTEKYPEAVILLSNSTTGDTVLYDGRLEEAKAGSVRLPVSPSGSYTIGNLEEEAYESFMRIFIRKRILIQNQTWKTQDSFLICVQYLLYMPEFIVMLAGILVALFSYWNMICSELEARRKELRICILLGARNRYWMGRLGKELLWLTCFSVFPGVIFAVLGVCSLESVFSEYITGGVLWTAGVSSFGIGLLLLGAGYRKILRRMEKCLWE